MMKTSQCTDIVRDKRRVAFFAGSFDPFTIGHEDIVNRALRLFDEVIIAIGVNPAKRGFMSVDKRKQWIEACFPANDRVRVVSFSGLAAQAAVDHRACCFVKGVRTMQDYEYEMTMAHANRDLCGLDTVLLFSDPVVAHVSSTLVRQLHSLGAEVRHYLPDSAPLNLLP